MVLEGGCRWVQIGASALDGRECSLKEAVTATVPLCQENDAFLVVEDDVDLVDELKVHGVFLKDGSRETVSQARERLGAHAIIGVAVKSFADIKALVGLDVDYVSVSAPSDADDGNPLSVAAWFGHLVRQVRGEGIDFHIVAEGDFDRHLLPALLEAGCAGVAESSAILKNDDPVAATALIVDVLDRARFGNGIADSDIVNV